MVPFFYELWSCCLRSVLGALTPCPWCRDIVSLVHNHPVLNIAVLVEPSLLSCQHRVLTPQAIHVDVTSDTSSRWTSSVIWLLEITKNEGELQAWLLYLDIIYIVSSINNTVSHAAQQSSVHLSLVLVGSHSFGNWVTRQWDLPAFGPKVPLQTGHNSKLHVLLSDQYLLSRNEKL